MFGISKLYVYGAAALLVIVALTSTYYYVKSIGREEVKIEVDKQNAKAKDKAIESNISVDQCYDLDGVWDQRTGKCIR